MIEWKIYKLEITESTNDAALAYADEGSVIFAEEQTKGRGRLGRTWESQRGNLFCSVVISVKDIPFIPYLSFSSAVSLGEALAELCQKHSFLRAHITYKWPNDVMLNSKKIAGILLEIAENPQRVIIGIGLNIKTIPKGKMNYPVSSLFEAGIKTEVEEVLKLFLKHLNKNIYTLRRDGFSSIRGRWLKNAEKIAQTITVRLANNSICGVFKGISEQGNLILFIPQEEKEIIIPAGEIIID